MTKAKSLRMAKEEKKKRKAEIRTKYHQEGASTSTIPQSQAPTALLSKEKETPSTTHPFDEGPKPMDIEDKDHREGKAPMQEEKKPEPKPVTLPAQTQMMGMEVMMMMTIKKAQIKREKKKKRSPRTHNDAT